MVLKIRTGIGLVLILGRTDSFCLNKESFGFSTFANFILQINITLPDIFDLPIYSSKKPKSWKNFWQNTG
jgi:hypothetical protein